MRHRMVIRRSKFKGRLVEIDKADGSKDMELTVAVKFKQREWDRLAREVSCLIRPNVEMEIVYLK